MNPVYFVTIVHGPDSFFVDHPLADARAVTRCPAKAKALLANLLQSEELFGGICESCARRFKVLRDVVGSGAPCPWQDQTDFCYSGAPCPWQDQTDFCYCAIVSYDIGAESVYEFQRRLMRTAWAKLNGREFLLRATREETRVEVLWDTLYEEGIANA